MEDELGDGKALDPWFPGALQWDRGKDGWERKVGLAVEKILAGGQSWQTEISMKLKIDCYFGLLHPLEGLE